MTYQPVTMTDAQSIWVDSPNESILGFGNSTRVQITANPGGVFDNKEKGDAYEAVLQQGLWPDDDELRYMVLGVPPGTPEAEAFMAVLAPVPMDTVAEPPTKEYIQRTGKRVLREAVRLMPLFGGCVQRMIFVKPDTPRYVQDTVMPGTAAITGRTLVKMSFGEWRLKLDLALRKAGLPMTEDLEGLTIQDFEEFHEAGMTIEEAVDDINTRLAGPASDGDDAGDPTDD